jgi:hypothetical protein
VEVAGVQRREPRGTPGRAAAVVSAIVVTAVFVLAGCAAGPNEAAGAGDGDLAGFWLGLWHGLISPVTFVVSLFNHDVNIYEVRNDGNWYNFGFILGVALVFSGGARSGSAAQVRRRS